MLDDRALATHPGTVVETNATEDVYRQWAPSYDDPANALLELDLPFIDTVLEQFPAGIAIDTACGTGRLTRRLAARGHRVVGFDRSGAMLRQAREKVPGVRFVRATMDYLPVPDASVDLVTNALAMTHVADLRPVLAEWARVLRPGGSAIITDVHPDLALLGSVPKGEGADGHPQQAACHRPQRRRLSAGRDVHRIPGPRLRRTTPRHADGDRPRAAAGARDRDLA